MRICMVSEDFIPNPGGIASHVYELARALIKKGHEVSFVCAHYFLYSQFKNKVDLYGASDIYNIPMSNNLISRVRLITYRKRIIERLYARKRFDIVHWHCLFYESLLALSLKKNLKCGFVFTNHTSGFLMRMRNPLWRMLMRKLISTADCIIAPSEELALATTRLGIPDSSVFMIPNGVDTELFNKVKPNMNNRIRYSIPIKSFVAICPRRLVFKNGVDLIIKAWARIVKFDKNVMLIIVGDGPEKIRLISLIKELRLERQILMLGSKDRSEMPEMYKIADFAVIPSRVEAVSVAALEAMASGLPVIATRVGGLPQIVIHNQNGKLVDPESPDSLADEIIDLISDENRLLQIGRNARNFVLSDYTWDMIADQTMRVYLRALSCHN